MGRKSVPFLHPSVFLWNTRKVFVLNGRPVGTRTPDLYRVNSSWHARLPQRSGLRKDHIRDARWRSDGGILQCRRDANLLSRDAKGIVVSNRRLSEGEAWADSEKQLNTFDELAKRENIGLATSTPDEKASRVDFAPPVASDSCPLDEDK